MKIVFEEEDWEELSERLHGPLGGQFPSQKFMEAFVEANPDLVALAARWGWSDTEVGDECYTAVPTFFFGSNARNLMKQQTLERDIWAAKMREAYKNWQEENEV